jgi:tetratricopeptide (TPR) repeat protein
MAKQKSREKRSSNSNKGASVVTLDLENPRSLFLICSLLFVLVVWVFLPTLRGNFLFFDENVYVVMNPHVNSGLNWENIAWAFSSLEYSNWHPLTWLSHMVDVQVYGLNPWGHHLTNVLLHAVNTVLVFLVFRRMTGAARRSLVVALLFGLHPLRVESVAWISERKDVLSTMFWLLAMWTYAKFAEESKGQSGKTKLFYGLTLLFFVMGLMSKTMLVTLPFVFLLLDYWPLKRWEQKNKWNLFFEKIPFFLLTITVSIIAYIAQQRSGTLQEMDSLPLSDRLGNAVISYVRYLGKFFWPENLCVYYPHPGHWPTMKVLAASLLLICISLFAFMQRRRKPYLFTGWFWYLGTLVPVIGLVQLESQSIADRYTYVPLIGIYVVLVWGLCELTERLRQRTVLLSIFAVAAIIACVVSTRYEIGFWKDSFTLWDRAIAVTENNYIAHNNLGILLQPTEHEAALREFQEAARINPDFAAAQRYLADELSLRGRFDEAIAHYRKSLESEPASGWAEYGLGDIFYKKGQVDEAIVHFQKSVEAEPGYVESHESLALIFFGRKQYDKAVIQFQAVAQYEPNDAGAQSDLGVAFYRNGQINEAVSQFQKALKLEPNLPAAHTNLEFAIKHQMQTMTQSNQSPQRNLEPVH